MMGHNMFLWRNIENYPHIIHVTLAYLEHGLTKSTSAAVIGLLWYLSAF